ncbi:unnamed protein product, partial [Ectocarpus sp. 13 AM-2016]
QQQSNTRHSSGRRLPSLTNGKAKMFGTRKVVRGIQGRAVVIARRAGRRSPRRSLQHRALEHQPAACTATAAGVLLPGSSSSTGRAAYSTTAPAERGAVANTKATRGTRGHAARPEIQEADAHEKAAVVNGKVVPGTEDIVQERFLACVEKGDANAAMAHFAFISCDARERGAQEQALREELVALRRRQLLELLCEKGMVNEASELLANAVASPGFNSRDSSTIASFMYVMCACLRQESFVGGVQQAPLDARIDRALLHFRQASERGISLALPVCEDLALALFVKGLRGEATEMEAWNVLEYVRQRDMVPRPAVYEGVLMCALGSGDLSFALRVCQHVDDEGLVLDPHVQDTLFRTVEYVMKERPGAAAVSVSAAPRPVDGGAVAAGRRGDDATNGGVGGGEWKVEGTNATMDELRALDTLLQSWLEAEMGEFDDVEDDDDDDDLEDEEEIQEFEITVEGSDEGDGASDLDDDDHDDAAAEWDSDVVDYDGGDLSTMTDHDVRHIAEDVVDFHDDGNDDDDDDDDDDIDNLGGGGGGTKGGGEKASGRGPSSSPQSSSRIAWTEQQPGRDADDYGDPSRPQSSLSTAPDFGGEKYCGDLTDQVSEFIPFKGEGEDYNFPNARGRRRGGVRSRQERSERHRSLDRQSVYADLVMPYGDPHGEGGQGIVSIPIKFSVLESQDDDDDDDGGGGGGVSS